jgi:hypothetical protein
MMQIENESDLTPSRRARCDGVRSGSFSICIIDRVLRDGVRSGSLGSFSICSTDRVLRDGVRSDSFSICIIDRLHHEELDQ